MNDLGYFEGLMGNRIMGDSELAPHIRPSTAFLCCSHCRTPESLFVQYTISEVHTKNRRKQYSLMTFLVKHF